MTENFTKADIIAEAKAVLAELREHQARGHHPSREEMQLVQAAWPELVGETTGYFTFVKHQKRDSSDTSDDIRIRKAELVTDMVRAQSEADRLGMELPLSLLSAERSLEVLEEKKEPNLAARLAQDWLVAGLGLGTFAGAVIAHNTVGLSTATAVIGGAAGMASVATVVGVIDTAVQMIKAHMKTPDGKETNGERQKRLGEKISLLQEYVQLQLAQQPPAPKPALDAEDQQQEAQLAVEIRRKGMIAQVTEPKTPEAPGLEESEELTPTQLKRLAKLEAEVDAMADSSRMVVAGTPAQPLKPGVPAEPKDFWAETVEVAAEEIAQTTRR